MYAAGLKEAETVYCTVNTGPLVIAIYFEPHLQGKIKRTKPFYIKQFEYLRTLVQPEVRYFNTILTAQPFQLWLYFLGCEIY